MGVCDDGRLTVVGRNDYKSVVGIKDIKSVVVVNRFVGGDNLQIAGSHEFGCDIFRIILINRMSIQA
jgi:hypothetical protein